MLIPPWFTHKGLRNVAIACDFKNVEQVITLLPVKKIPDLFRSALHIVKYFENRILGYSESRILVY